MDIRSMCVLVVFLLFIGSFASLLHKVRENSRLEKDLETTRLKLTRAKKLKENKKVPVELSNRSVSPEPSPEVNQTDGITGEKKAQPPLDDKPATPPEKEGKVDSAIRDLQGHSEFIQDIRWMLGIRGFLTKRFGARLVREKWILGRILDKTATYLGLTAWQKTIFRDCLINLLAEIDLIKAKMRGLEKQLARARKAGDKNLVRRLKKEINRLDLDQEKSVVKYSKQLSLLLKDGNFKRRTFAYYLRNYLAAIAGIPRWWYD